MHILFDVLEEEVLNLQSVITTVKEESAHKLF